MWRSRVDLWHGRWQRATDLEPPVEKPIAWHENKSGEAIHNKYLQTGDSNILLQERYTLLKEQRI